MLRTAQVNYWIRGFNDKPGDSVGLSIFLPQYANNILVFCDANSDQMKYLGVIFISFEVISGFHVNFGKVFVCPINEVQGISSLYQLI